MFNLVHRIGCYENTPVGYSPAWHDYIKHLDVCFPIGIHWIARWGRSLWMWTLHPRRGDTAVHHAISAAEYRGYVDGVKEGRRLAAYEMAKVVDEMARAMKKIQSDDAG